MTQPDESEHGSHPQGGHAEGPAHSDARALPASGSLPLQPLPPHQGGIRPVPRPTTPSRRWIMPVTYAVMIACALLYGWEKLSPAAEWKLALIPAAVPEQPWRLVTGAFLHDRSSLAHIGSNMVSLWIFGRMLEPLFGSARFGAVLGTSILTASGAVCLLEDPYTLTVGMSGGIFGLIGAALVMSLRNRANLRGVLVLLALNLALPLFAGNISWQAHVGGLLGGIVAAALVAARGARRSQA